MNFSFSSKEQPVEPVILLHLPLENDQEKIIELPIENFHALRQRTAILLKNFLDIKNKIET